MKHVKFTHRMVMETTNYTVMCCSEMKSEAGGLWKRREVQGGEKKGENRVLHVGRKFIEIIFLT